MPVIAIRITDHEKEQLERIQEALQRRYDRQALPGKATQHAVFSMALDELEKRIQDWERKR